MADIPQEVREAAPMSYAEYGLAMYKAGKRAGMERAAEIARTYADKWGNANGFESQCVGAKVIAQAIRSDNDGHG